MKSRWFPASLALFQTILYFGLLGHDYWSAVHKEHIRNLREYFHEDLARPLFEPPELCQYCWGVAPGQSAVLGLDAPAHLGTILLYSAMNRQLACQETLLTPRGQLVTAAFVPPLWVLEGLSSRRLAQRRWHRRLTGRLSRSIVFLGLIPSPLGAAALLMGVLSIFALKISIAVRLLGLGFWLLFLSVLAEERLRVWPFRSVDVSARV